jgi:competence protein ComEC
MWLSLAFLAGILLADQWRLPWAAWSIAAATSLLLAVLAKVFQKRLPPNLLRLSPSLWTLLLLALAAAFSGALRHRISLPDIEPGQIAWYKDRQYDLLITAMVASPPDEREDYTNLRLQVRLLDTGDGDQEASGLLLARIEPGETFHYGDILRLRGRLVTPPENDSFSYRDYLANQRIHAWMPAALVTRLPFGRSGNLVLRLVYDLKEKALTTLYAIFPDPEASLLAGILLGNEKGLPAGLLQAFRDTGTAHIIAISGFNITILAALIVRLFNRLLGPRRGAWAALAGISLYTLMVGAEAPVVRAAIMGGLGLFARQVGRRQTGLNTLAFTAAAMCLFDPLLPWDVGFQLSFTATLGIILYATPLQDWAARLISRRLPPGAAARIANLLTEYVFLTLAAQLTTLPIQAAHFGRLPLLSLPANILILPVQPPVMLLGGLALLAGFIHIPLGQILAWAAMPFTAYTIHMVELLAKLPGGVILLGEFSVLFVILFYAVLFLFTFSRGSTLRLLRQAVTPSVLLGTLSILTFLIWRSSFSAPDGRLHLTFLDVGSAETVLIKTPSGRWLLINGGPSSTALSDNLGRRLPPFDRSLDWLIVASPQEEQVAALPEVLKRYPAHSVLWAGNTQASFSSMRVDEWLTHQQVPVVPASTGDALDLGAGARLEVLGVTPRGAVLLIEWGEFSALLPIGLNHDVLVELENGSSIGAVDVLLLSDSGYAPLNPPEWIAALDPQVFILCVAADDTGGLPDSQVLELTGSRSLLRTDLHGWIDVSTDGRNLQVKVENP